MKKKMVTGKTVKFGTRVPNSLLSGGVVAVNEKTWNEWGTKAYGEKNVIKMFDTEDEYWIWMRRNKKKTFKTKNSDGSVTIKTVKYMPRYEVAALASYDDGIKFQQMSYDKTTGKFFTVPRKAQSQVVVMSEKNIFG